MYAKNPAYPLPPEEAKKLADIDRGRISLLGIKNALNAKGLQAEGISADIKSLKTLVSQGTVITIINKGCHFVIVLDVNESAVKIYDPSLNNKTFDYSLNLFRNDWSGKVLFVRNASGTAVFGAAAASAVSRARSEDPRPLSLFEMQAEKAPPACRNGLLDPGLPWWLKLLLSADPVVLANGNLSSEETDLLIQTKGLIPLEIKRTYNSQSPAMLDQWTPELGAGPWRIVNGEYCGHGDRSISNFMGGGYTLTLKMKTITAGTNEPWMTARVNFNFRNADNTYYVLIGRNGKVELGRVIDGLYYVISHNTDLSPTDWNTVKIASNVPR